jgi:hypothetical protein
VSDKIYRNLIIINLSCISKIFLCELFQTVSWNNIDIDKIAECNSYLNNIQTVGSYVEITCEAVIQEDLEVVLYNLGWFGMCIVKI